MRFKHFISFIYWKVDILWKDNQQTYHAREICQTYYLSGTFAGPRVHLETLYIYHCCDLWTAKGQTGTSSQSQNWIVLRTSEARKLSEIREINCSIKWVYLVPKLSNDTYRMKNWRINQMNSNYSAKMVNAEIIQVQK